jgi:hypothetical protein
MHMHVFSGARNFGASLTQCISKDLQYSAFF